MAIEYYDYEKKDQLHKLFLNKLNELMSRNTVIAFLDEISQKKENNIMEYDNVKLNKELFPHFDENSETINSNNSKRRLTSDILDSYVHVEPSKKKPNNKEIKKNKDELNEKLFSLNSNLNKIKDNISFDTKNQSNIFEQKKKNKMEKIKSCRGNKK